MSPSSSDSPSVPHSPSLGWTHRGSHHSSPRHPGDVHQVWLNTPRRVKCHRVLVVPHSLECPVPTGDTELTPAQPLPDTPTATLPAILDHSVENTV